MVSLLLFLILEVVVFVVLITVLMLFYALLVTLTPVCFPSYSWMHQHECLEKLNMQAHQSAKNNTDEFILEAFITFDKLHVLIYDLLCIEAWKEYLLPLLIDEIVERKATMRTYFILYHEATVVNLLEVSACTYVHT